MSDDFRQNVGWSLPQSGAVSGRSQAVFGLEVASESVSVGKTAGLTNPLNTEFRLSAIYAHHHLLRIKSVGLLRNNNFRAGCQHNRKNI